MYVEISPYPYRHKSFDGIVKNKSPGKLHFLYHEPVPLSCTYIL